MFDFMLISSEKVLDFKLILLFQSPHVN